MTIDELRRRKEKTGMTYEEIARKSGVPLTTVQKIFGGFTKSPRYSTMEAIEKALCVRDDGAAEEFMEKSSQSAHALRETGPEYNAGSSAASRSHVKYPRQGSYTVQDRNALPGDTRTELIDGVIYDMAAPKTIHQALQTEIMFQLSSYINENGGDCMCFASDTDVIIDTSNHTVVMPDILIVCDRSKIHEDAIYGAPDLVIEILSPSTQRKDFTAKYNRYAEAGVREYWIVDPKGQKVIVYRLDLINAGDGEDGNNMTDSVKTGSNPELHPGEKIAIYGFDAEVPVGIYGGDCRVDFRAIHERLRFMF